MGEVEETLMETIALKEPTFFTHSPPPPLHLLPSLHSSTASHSKEVSDDDEVSDEVLTKTDPVDFESPDHELAISLELAESVFEDLLLEEIIENLLEFHRFVKLGLGFLKSDVITANLDSSESNRRSPNKRKMVGGKPVVSPTSVSLSPLTDVFGQPLASAAKSIRNQECCCPKCDRNMAATRFAPHLEKCMGMGRNCYRMANRRMAGRAASERNSAQAAAVSSTVVLSRIASGTRNSYRGSAGVEVGGVTGKVGVGDDNLEESEEEDEHEYNPELLEEDDDDDWLAMSRRRRNPKKKTNRNQDSSRGRKATTAITIVPGISTQQPSRVSQTQSEGFLLNELLDTPPLGGPESEYEFTEDTGSEFLASLSTGFNHNLSSSTGGAIGESIQLRNRSVKRSGTKLNEMSSDDNSSRDALPDTFPTHKSLVDDDIYMLDDGDSN